MANLPDRFWGRWGHFRGENLPFPAVDRPHRRGGFPNVAAPFTIAIERIGRYQLSAEARHGYWRGGLRRFGESTPNED